MEQTTAKKLPDYEIRTMPLTALKEHPNNPRTIRDTALKGLIASLEHFGLIQPIIWNKRSGHIVGGHQRKKALEAGGYAEAQVLVVDFDEAKEVGALISLNNERIQGEWSDTAPDMLVEYEDLYPEAARELMLHDLKVDLMGEPSPDPLSMEPPIYSADRIVAAAFDYFRDTGFPYQMVAQHVAMQQINRLAAMPAEAAVRSNLAYHVADTFNPHRYHERVNGKSLVEYFDNDEWLKKAIGKEIELGGAVPAGYFGMMTSVSGSQALANFRPGFAMYLYRRYGKKGGAVLDPCTGYGGRLVGWVASQLGGRYIGVDPSTKTSRGNRAMVATLDFPGVTLIQKPFEDSAQDVLAALKGTDGIDFAFTSPPYFSKEKYSEEETQSWKRYPEIDSWNSGFLMPLFGIIAPFLKPDGVIAINIADVNIGGKTIPLEDMTVRAARAAGLDLKETLRFDLPHIPGTNSEKFTSSEPVFVFRHPA